MKASSKNLLVTTAVATTVATMGATVASADLVQWASPGGDWNVGSNWNSGSVPTVNDIAYFGSFQNLDADPVTITFDQDTVYGNLSGDNGEQGVVPAHFTFDLNGHTLSSSGDESQIKFNLVVTDGTLASSANGFWLTQDARDNPAYAGNMTVGEGGVVQASGGLYQVRVGDGSSLNIAGGRFEPYDDSRRNIVAEAGGTIYFAGAGSMVGDQGHLADGSTLSYTLNNSGYYDAAPFVLDDVRSLGDFSFDLADGFTAEAGDILNLVSLTFNQAPGVENQGFSTHQFDNVADGDVLAQGGYLFEANYDNNAFSLQVVPEPATFGLLALGGLAMLGRGRRA